MAEGKRQRAVIWDLDGVIVDSARFHLAAWQQWARELGRTFSEEQFFRLFGFRNSDIILRFLGPDIPAAEVEALGERKEELFRSLVRGKIKPLPGALPLLHALKEGGWRLALTSSGPLQSTRLILSSLGIETLFECLVSALELSRGKPAPDLFLVAASKLGMAPDCCVVIEDGIEGVQGAKAAGMKCLAVATTNPRQSLGAADLIVDTLEVVAAEDIEHLLQEPPRPSEAARNRARCRHL